MIIIYFLMWPTVAGVGALIGNVFGPVGNVIGALIGLFGWGFFLMSEMGMTDSSGRLGPNSWGS